MHEVERNMMERKIRIKFIEEGKLHYNNHHHLKSSSCQHHVIMKLGIIK